MPIPEDHQKIRYKVCELKYQLLTLKTSSNASVRKRLILEIRFFIISDLKRSSVTFSNIPRILLSMFFKHDNSNESLNYGGIIEIRIRVNFTVH